MERECGSARHGQGRDALYGIAPPSQDGDGVKRQKVIWSSEAVGADGSVAAAEEDAAGMDAFIEEIRREEEEAKELWAWELCDEARAADSIIGEKSAPIADFRIADVNNKPVFLNSLYGRPLRQSHKICQDLLFRFAKSSIDRRSPLGVLEGPTNVKIST